MPELTRFSRLLFVVMVLLGSTGATWAQNNLCDVAGEEPDVIVGDIPSVHRWGNLHGITSFSIGTESCNIGTCWLNWIAGDVNHPVIGQSMFRLMNGRFEQIGQSWLKHGFATFDDPLCSDFCIPADGQHLGVNCSDLYWAGLNGSQNGLGPKQDVNPYTGVHNHDTPADSGDPIYKRLQVHDADLAPLLNPGALYFVEGQYVTADDAAAGNSANNNSYRSAFVTENNGIYNVQTTDQTEREKPAIEAWADSDPSVRISSTTSQDDGLVMVGSKATPLGNGFWHYEYAVQNLTSNRAVGGFRVPVPAGVQVAGIDFHDVDYHSGEPYDGTDWVGQIESTPFSNEVVWRTEPFVVNPDANALRWGTLYNFRFDVAVKPTVSSVTLEFFAPGTSPEMIAGQIHVPQGCFIDGVCDPTEACTGCGAADCLDQGGLGGCCGDDVCDPGETACSCERDCGPCVQSCGVPADCDDGKFCNGTELCTGGFCAPGAEPCTGQLCDEGTDSCLPCLTDFHCTDGDPCTGIETCVAGSCVAGTDMCPDDGLFCNGEETCVNGNCFAADPCPGIQCDETLETCFVCNNDAHCDDGIFCNGVETCLDDTCVPGAGDPCPEGQPCNESGQICEECFANPQCDDGIFCNGEEICQAPGFCTEALTSPCVAMCDEPNDQCVGNVFPQEIPGQPLRNLSPTEQALFSEGALLFDRIHDASMGLGPVYNAPSCGSCHSLPVGGRGPTVITHFGDDSGGSFDALLSLGGSLMQSQAVSPACEETLPPQANVTTQRITTSTLGVGLVEAVEDSTLEALALAPPPGLSGRAHSTEALEAPGASRVGRFGWKAGSPTVLSYSAEEARNHLGLTNRLLLVENAPNGDPVLLATCDTIADPEDGPDAGGLDLIDRVTHFQRYLAPPPQTPQAGMSGELWFTLSGCNGCHTSAFTTPDDPLTEWALRNRTLKPYSDFLLHEMGSSSDQIAQGDAAEGEMRTAPLWGLRDRSELWHDGRINGGTFEDRVLAAIALHDVPGSEAQSSAQSFLSQSTLARDAVIVFLDSLGRREFDHDGDSDVDRDDFALFNSCFSGPGFFYTPDDPCSVSDVDRDGDVDDDDRVLFNFVAEGDAGEVPAGSLTVNLDPGGATLTLGWDASCQSLDSDYAVYEGNLGEFSSHVAVTCSTAGATSKTITPSAGSRYYVIVPNNGFHEGSYGRDSAGFDRVQATPACMLQATGECP